MDIVDLSGSDFIAKARAMRNGEFGQLADGSIVVKEAGLFQTVTSAPPKPERLAKAEHVGLVRGQPLAVDGVQVGSITYVQAPGYTLEFAKSGASEAPVLRPAERPVDVETRGPAPLFPNYGVRLGPEGRLVDPSSGLIGHKPRE